MPAPMVAASATAILNDINLSVSLPSPPPGPSNFAQTVQIPVCPRIFNRVD
jgi:hypothetical protein